MDKKIAKALAIIAVLIPLVIWIYKVSYVVEVEQRNDRVEINNSVVRILNDLQESMQGPRPLFERFLSLDQLTESEQRGTWGLLDLMDFDYQAKIDAAKSELEMTFKDVDEQDKVLLEPAMNLLDAYSGYGNVYKQIAETIKSKELSSDELKTLLIERYQELDTMVGEPLVNFSAVQQAYIKGE